MEVDVVEDARGGDEVEKRASPFEWCLETGSSHVEITRTPRNQTEQLMASGDTPCGVDVSLTVSPLQMDGLQ